MRTLLYSTGVTAMVGAFVFWFAAVIGDDTTAGAVGMLTFLLGVLLAAVGAAMDYRTEHTDTVETVAAEYEPPQGQEFPRP